MAKSTRSWTTFSFTKVILLHVDSSAGVPNKVTDPEIRFFSSNVFTANAQATP